MSPDPHNTLGTAAADRRQAVWPWLLLPLVALALFFALRAVNPAPHPAAHASDTVESAPIEASESP